MRNKIKYFAELLSKSPGSYHIANENRCMERKRKIQTVREKR